MRKMDLYWIRAISNLHVGSGEGDFSVVDKQVQRDPVTDLPTIHASGIKGALREAMTHWARQGEDRSEQESGIDHEMVEKLFGAAPKPKDASTNGTQTKPRKISQGINNFFDGKLFALPIRSSHHFFYLATCPMLVSGLINDLNTFFKGSPLEEGLEHLSANPPAEGSPFYFGQKYADGTLRLEDWKAIHPDHKLNGIHNLLGDRIALLHDNDFKKLAGELPIIARNYLENGISNNLWYEEVVPREARFYTMVSRLKQEDGLNDFLAQRNHLVQLGANATVGYGLCEFKKIT